MQKNKTEIGENAVLLRGIKVYNKVDVHIRLTCVSILLLHELMNIVTSAYLYIL